MDDFREAWISNEPASRCGAVHRGRRLLEDAFAEPWRGREEIVRRWTAGISQEVAMTYEVEAVDGDRAFVHWHVITQNRQTRSGSSTTA